MRLVDLKEVECYFCGKAGGLRLHPRFGVYSNGWLVMLQCKYCKSCQAPLPTRQVIEEVASCPDPEGP